MTTIGFLEAENHHNIRHIPHLLHNGAVNDAALYLRDIKAKFPGSKVTCDILLGIMKRYEASL